jgi:hypothetical protein
MDYIYLLQEREFISTRQQIFKLGKTTQRNLVRFLQHSKGSQLLFQGQCFNADNLEYALRRQFLAKYTPREDYGRKYFQGCAIDMLADICSGLRAHILNPDIHIELGSDDTDDGEYDSDEESDEESDDVVMEQDEQVAVKEVAKEVTDDDDDDDSDSDDDDETDDVETDDDAEVVDMAKGEEEEEGDQEFFHISKIVGCRKIHLGSEGAEFQVRWKGYSAADDTFEPYMELLHTEALFEYMTSCEITFPRGIRNEYLNLVRDFDEDDDIRVMLNEYTKGC